MMGVSANLKTHLLGGLTTLCNVWEVTRRDGVFMGFTDHDQPLSFDNKTFRADSGMSALALQRSTGLSVDNTDALGALHDTSITTEDINAGRTTTLKCRLAGELGRCTQRVVMFRGHMAACVAQGGLFKRKYVG